MERLPSEGEVREWLRHYQEWCQRNQPLPPDMTAGGGDRFSENRLRLTKEGPDAATRLWMDQIEIFEQAYGAYERFRTAIGQAHFKGYNAGRDGEPRESCPYEIPCHEAFSWLNGWNVGEYDRLWKAGLVVNLRFPGVRRPPKVVSLG